MAERPVSIEGVAVVLLPKEKSFINNIGTEPIKHLTLAYYPAMRSTDAVNYFELLRGIKPTDTIATVAGKGHLGPERKTVIFVEDHSINRVREDVLDVMGRNQVYPHFIPHITVGHESFLQEMMLLKTLHIEYGTEIKFDRLGFMYEDGLVYSTYLKDNAEVLNG